MQSGYIQALELQLSSQQQQSSSSSPPTPPSLSPPTDGSTIEDSGEERKGEKCERCELLETQLQDKVWISSGFTSPSISVAIRDGVTAILPS